MFSHNWSRICHIVHTCPPPFHVPAHLLAGPTNLIGVTIQSILLYLSLIRISINQPITPSTNLRYRYLAVQSRSL